MPPPLVERIRREIRERGPLSFARFMELALYDPAGGYYARGEGGLGPDGDFFTASDAGHGFGRALARQLAEIDLRLGRPDPFRVVEYGAGRGLLARDLIDALGRDRPELGSRTRIVLVDRSAAMRAAARRTVPEAHCLPPGDVPRGGCGCVLAVELFDALPVHRVRRRGERLVEVRVALGAADGLVEVETEPEPEVARRALAWGAAAGDGWEAEVALGLDAELSRMGEAIERGAMIIVDYGDDAAGLYDVSRAHGTLRAYSAHRTGTALLEHVGRQDLTAHVNFSALEDAARACGWKVLGRTSQDRFLIANGILDAFAAADLAEARDPRRVKRRLQAMQLIHPSGMGRAFQVLLLARGADLEGLAGLADPFASGRR